MLSPIWGLVLLVTLLGLLLLNDPGADRQVLQVLGWLANSGHWYAAAPA